MDCIERTRSDETLNNDEVIRFPKQVIHEDPDFTVLSNDIVLPNGGRMTFIHLDIYNWSPSTMKRLKHLWPSLSLTLPPIVYACGDVTDAKWRSFMRHFGFKSLLEDCLCTDGISRPIYFFMR